MDSLNQIYYFLICVCVGLFMGIIYDIGYILRKTIKNKLLEFFLDTMFFVAFSLIMIIIGICFSFPDFRMYMYMGNMLGLLIYFKTIHIIVAFLSGICYNRLEKVIKRRNAIKTARKKEVKL